MYIVPYVLEEQKASHSEFCIQTLWLFLTQKGKALWETDEKIKITQEFVQKEYLIPNGFVGRIQSFTKDICFFEVDQTKTNIKDFYMWLDKGAEEDTMVWRPFFRITGNESYQWEEEAKKHSLGALTVQDIWTMVLRLSTEKS